MMAKASTNIGVIPCKCGNDKHSSYLETFYEVCLWYINHCAEHFELSIDELVQFLLAKFALSSIILVLIVLKK